MQTVTNSTQTVANNTQTVTNAKKALNLTTKLRLKVPTNASANYAKNTLSHSNSKNKTPYALICIGANKWAFIGVGAKVILPSGKVVVITQITQKQSAQKNNKLVGLQGYIKWQTQNGLFSGGNFTQLKGLQYKIFINKNKTLATKTAKLTPAHAKTANTHNISNSAIINVPTATKLPKPTVSAIVKKTAPQTAPQTAPPAPQK